jgi:hypothetical protein
VTRTELPALRAQLSIEGERLTRVAGEIDALLAAVAAPIDGLRPAVLGRPLAARLDEYRRFRHAFRHMYFFDIDWLRVQPLLAGSRAVGEQVLSAAGALAIARERAKEVE